MSGRLSISAPSHSGPVTARSVSLNVDRMSVAGIDSFVASGLLRQVMSAARIAWWDAWLNPLQLISFSAPNDDDGCFGLDAAQLVPGTLWEDNIYPADRPRLLAYLQERTSDLPTPSVDYRLIVGEGELWWVRHWTVDRQSARGQRAWVRNLIMPIPEQKHLEWECVRVSERECNRIGQELHDDLCQVLAGLVFMMRVVGRRAQQLDPLLAAEIEELGTHVAGATDRVRSMAHGLFPAQLNYATLPDALEALSGEARMLFRIELATRLPATVPRHRPEQIIHVYRIIQEAVTNAVRHGQATAVKVRVSRIRDRLRIRIEDNGAGVPAASARPEGIGIHVMQYRARGLGGTLELRALSPRGVVVILSYPVNPSRQPPVEPNATP
jgi:signal transduction histidine kinase